MEEPKYKLQKLLQELGAVKGRHTELVSVYIPAGHSIIDVVNQLKSEQGTAENIKSKSTRKNVIGALEKAIQTLKLFKETPPNGLALFSGNVSEHEGSMDIKVWTVEPPEELRVRLYRCDSTFILEHLQEMLEEREVYGLVVMDTQEAAIGILKGKQVIMLRHFRSIVPGKTSKGGQSAQRFERVREGLVNDWYKNIAEQARALLPSEMLGLIVGGPGPAKKEWVDQEYMIPNLRKKYLGLQDTGYADEHGLHELVERAKDLLAEASVAKERELVKKFLEHLQKGTGLVAYGFNSVIEIMERGAVDMLLVSEGLDDDEVTVCDAGHVTLIKASNPHKCRVCGKDTFNHPHGTPLEFFEKEAKNYGTKVEVISNKTREGEQLIALGGVGAILRYRVD